MLEKSKISNLAKPLTAKLAQLANPEAAKKIKAYMKGLGEYRGIAMPVLRSLSNEFIRDTLSSATRMERKEVGFLLLESEFNCDRLCGTLVLGAESKEIRPEDLERVFDFFREGKFEGWAMTDQTCINLLKKVARSSKKFSEIIANLSREENEWIRRISNVTFITMARFGDSHPNFAGFSDLMFEACERTVRSEFRFTQLGCGWLLRELSLADRNRVVQFIRQNLREISPEGLRYAVEKMPAHLKKELIKEKKQQKI